MEGYRCELDWAGYLDFLELLHFGYLGFFYTLFLLVLSLRDMVVGSFCSLPLPCFACAGFGNIKGICVVGEGVHLGLLEIQLLSV